MCGMPQQHQDRSSPSPNAPPRRPDASMSLLTNVMEHSLDDGYAEAAERRGVVGSSHLPTTLRAKLGLAAGLVLAALVVTLGAAQAKVGAPTAAKERQKLIERIQSGTDSADALQKSVDQLRDEVATKQHAALGVQGAGSTDLVSLLAGATPVKGPGVKLVVDDAKEAGQGTGGGPRQSSGFSDTGRVRDRDMQRIVNGLWASGAEAVAVNGQRLTALSAIRAAGDAILVDNKPLAPPYTVLAIGDGQRLSTAFQESADGQYLHVLEQSYGIRADISAEGEVRLPAAPSLIVRYAKPVPGNTKADAANTGKGTK
ncbi:DUF881 domain-containing protein [Streptomyces sp. H10-C2]|uniref:DUF881 domain-containing protein n=1 Tax=unclassified Streptomyces TaxID=2593676 RepID=UPI0024B8E1F0|nr:MULTISPECIES: DUF881 domain-containing protein [unclassified Streptomyces]MDJ0346993.1 DUF881 domain-containing protein [Streptomyces sp. PH10-H1]MDJ0375280.1 DUF881 domain-containing protein [Streptomyces sp. H10-C2]